MQKTFLSFLDNNEKAVVLSSSENLATNKQIGAFVEDESKNAAEIQANIGDYYFQKIPIHIVSQNKKDLYLQFRDQALIEEPTIFQTANGGTRDWIFNVRGFLLNSKNANLIFDAFWDIYKDQYPFQVCGETVAGGICAQLLSLKAQEKGIDINCFLVRQERKTTGTQNILEGQILEKVPVVICDDFFNMGNTVLYAMKVLKQFQAPLHSLFTFVDYETKEGLEFLEKNKIQLHSFFKLSNFKVQRKKETWKRKYLDINPEWTFKEETYFGYEVPKSSPCQDSDKIFFGVHSGYFYALNKKDGSVTWKFKTGEHIQKKSILSSPLIHENKVIFGSYDGNLYALDKETGKESWKFCDAEWIGSSPALSEKHRIVFIGMEYGIPGRRGGISAVNADTGEKIWEDFFEDYVHCSPAYSEEFDVVIIGSNCGKVRLYDAKSGQGYWELNIGEEVKMSFAFDETRGLVCFGAFDGKEYIVDITSGNIIKRIQTENIIYSSPYIHQEKLYFTSTDKKLYVFDLQTGKIAAEFLSSGKILSSPTTWKDYIVFGSNDARVYFINFERKECFFLQFTERMTNKVLFDEERCYLHLYNNEVQSFLLEEIEAIMI